MTANWYGRMLHFGVREHAMGSILSGIVLHGPTRAFGGTFLQFSDYMRPAVRLASLMDIDTIYIWTHDSIGLGEDGPTHQPIEHLAALRAIPRLSVVRPGDPNETAYAWRSHPGARRQQRSGRTHPDPPGHAGPGGHHRRGRRQGRVRARRRNPAGDPDVVIIATGSELQLAVERAKAAGGQGRRRRRGVDAVRGVVRDRSRSRVPRRVLPPAVSARVAVEAGVAQSWYKLVGDTGEIVSIEHYGASADDKTLFREFGFTPEAVVAAAERSLDN